MTVQVPLDAFDAATPFSGPARTEKDRFVSIGITLAIHVAVGVLALTAVHVQTRKPPAALTVEITEPKKLEVLPDSAPPPKMVQPLPIAMEMPVVTVKSVTPPPVTAIVAPPRAVPQAPPAPTGQGLSEGRESYFGKLLAQLNRYKRYPVAARKARVTGVVMLHFVMDAQGRVQSFSIAKSSGHPALDEEALALIQRAQPMPPLPADFPTKTLDAVVPVEFFLNR